MSAPTTYTLTFTDLTPVQLKRLEMALVFECDRRTREMEADLARPLVQRSAVMPARIQAELAEIQADFRKLHEQLRTQFPGLYKVIG